MRDGDRIGDENGEQPATRHCHNCGEDTATLRPFCPVCGRRYDRPFARIPDRLRRRIGVIGGLILLLAMVGTWTVFQREKSRSEAESERAMSAEQTLLARRIKKEQTPKYSGVKTSARRLTGVQKRRFLLTALNDSILRDARARAGSGELDGPIQRVDCTPLLERVTGEDPLQESRVALGRYDCVAVKRDVVQNGKVVAAYGHPFVGTINYDRASYVWCRDVKEPGERGKALVKVRLDPACLGAKGARRVGSGYALP